MEVRAIYGIDYVNDFASRRGSLYVRGGETLLPLINEIIAYGRANGMPVFLSREWHEEEMLYHFKKYKKHGVRNTWGAEFYPGLAVGDAIVISKGVHPRQHGYSGATRECIRHLVRLKITTIYLFGLATDYCVRATALDLRKAGFAVVLISDACRALDAEAGIPAIDKMKRAGAIITTTQEVLDGNI